jgi:hypothetical protein
MHCSVGIVQTLLKLNIFFVHFLYKYSHLTEYESIENSRNDHHDNNNNDFVVLSWSNFIQAKDHNCVVTHTEILLLVLIFEQRCSLVDEIDSWDPSLALFHREPQKTCQNMNVKNQHEHHLEYFQKSLCFLSVIESTNKLWNSSKSLNLEKTKDLHELSQEVVVQRCKYAIKRNGRKQVNYERTIEEVIQCNHFEPKYFITS